MSYSQILSQDAYPADALYRPVAQPCTPSQASIAPRKAAVPELAAAQQQSSSQVVVPSMSALVPLASAPYMGYYPQAYCQVPPSYMTHHHHHHHQQHQQQQRMLPAASYHLVNMHPPIHHTLENATITYDTVTEHGVQKDLVKDVFFSPAMIQETEERSSSCGSSQSDSESEAGTDSSSSFSPLVTPSDLLQQDDPLFFIGLEFNNSDEVSSTDNASCSSCSSATSGSNTKPAALEYLKRTTADLPTPPGSVDMEYVQLGDSLKRRLLESASASKKQKRTLTTPKSTPPASPMLPFDLDYFEDASAEESSSSDDDSDDDQNTLFFDLAGNPVVAGSEDDNDSTTSWEEHHFFEEEDDSEEEDDDDDDDDSASEHEEQVLPPLPPVRQVATRKHRQQTQTAVAPATVKQEEQQEQRQQQQQQATGVPPTPAEPVHDEFEGVEKVPPRPTAYPTIYQKLTKANVDWCRYCGTTEGVNWRPGPWGKRTLCNKHGCDYKGYGFACKLPRLDLTGFAHESIHDRERPVLQLFCAVCQRQESWQGNVLVRCEGCPKAVHQKCCPELLTDDIVASSEQWFCDAACRENTRRKRIVVELPRKRLPLMCAPKNNTSAASSSAHCSEGATRTTRSSSSSSFSR